MSGDNKQENGHYVSPERYAPHLSEFYPLVNNKAKNSEQKPIVETSEALLDSPMQSSVASGMFRIRRPSSLRSGVSTITDLQTLVTKKDMAQTVDAMKQMLANVDAYAEELVAVSQKASMVALSLEQMARLKGCNDDTAEKFLSSSGLFHLIANHQRIMANCITSSMTESLSERVDDFQFSSRVQEAKFKQEFRDQARKLKLQESYNIKFSKRKVRNLVSYRENLANLQLQLDELESLKHRYYQESYELVESCCSGVLRDIATVSRAQVEISENIARKGWSGGGLDDLLIHADDPFNKDHANNDDDDDDHEDDQNTHHTPEATSHSSPHLRRLTSTPLPVSIDLESPLSRRVSHHETQETFDNSFSLPAPGTRSDVMEDNESKLSENGDGEGESETKNLLDGLSNIDMREDNLLEQSSVVSRQM
ncbi:LAFE_0H05050g1_1 [Lachancea fermentati]|uniref:LAFE_0H05050g1_1 n=1 Tax=Lachancea fermentati TaxID=4955 RepID=A0A1G4MJP9_LACFM|nr:LAFE_0H05050g1_1 [Lachancea fermentati]